MSRFLLNTPNSLEEVKKFISDKLKSYGKQPAHIVFVCGDAHRPMGGTGDAIDICNQIAVWIIENAFSPYCSYTMCKDSVSLHVESGTTPKEIEKALIDSKINNIQELGLKNTTGWEPVGFADYDPINSLMSKDRMTEPDKKAALALIQESSHYFSSLKQGWTNRIDVSLVNLANNVEANKGKRDEALIDYGNNLLDARIDANMALGDSINNSINKYKKSFIHFISVGNAHIVEGRTIIEGIKITADASTLGFSIGRIKK